MEGSHRESQLLCGGNYVLRLCYAGRLGGHPVAQVPIAPESLDGLGEPLYISTGVRDRVTLRLGRVIWPDAAHPITDDYRQAEASTFTHD